LRSIPTAIACVSSRRPAGEWTFCGGHIGPSSSSG
jgi:hypothetical protein